jgi:signal transduction histidine kinase
MSQQKLFFQEIQSYIQVLNHNLITLTTSLKGRLSPPEEEALANLFQAQINLQSLLDEEKYEVEQEATIASLSQEEPFENVSDREVDSIAYAQAMQYARDLVKAMRQKKEQQRRLELTSQQLIRAEKLATVGQVAAAMAHELGNILTPLQMYATLIYKEVEDNNQQSEIAEFASHITQIANRASHMLRQLVDAARSERAIMIPVDLRDVIADTLALLSPQIKGQRINVHQHYPEHVPRVMGRPDQLEQVFINIGLNAFDVMPDGGDFTIILEPGDGTNQFGQADIITIHLKDTGTGIPPEDVGLLFEPFYTTKERGAGSGLGLFVSYLIIDQHGGAIEVESEPGQGTCFMIKLPTANKEEKSNVSN